MSNPIIDCQKCPGKRRNLRKRTFWGAKGSYWLAGLIWTQIFIDQQFIAQYDISAPMIIGTVSYQ